MVIAKPIVAVREYEQSDKARLSLVEQLGKLLVANRDTKLPPARLVDAAAFLQEQTGITFSTLNADTILFFYAEARIKLALYGMDSETGDLLLNAFAHFFLGTEWPSYKDGLTGEQLATWHEVFREQVIKSGMGFVA
ncbi:hypothetical protein [Ralstonia phage RP31]|uniref:Uncharacterized protein n=2 Tax=Ripduovirus RP12 TaxID=2560700 RepID=A0A1L7N1A2_9CAUD|nr:hypothetical protein FDH28_gp149 [Ralstonia phage RP12]BAW19246.1 hypothetical protein [Ralstonia phage RP12]BAW19532.1 hypothetical protein [Ralstonia phage RP31]